MRPVLTLFLAAITVLSFISCEKKTINAPVPQETINNINVSVFPDIGTLATKFKVSVSLNDSSKSSTPYLVSMDYNGDDEIDMDTTIVFSDANVCSLFCSYEEMGHKRIKILVEADDKNYGIAYDSVYVTKLVPILLEGEHGVTMNGNIAWSKDGSYRFTFDGNGYPHRIMMMEFPAGTPRAINDEGLERCQHFSAWAPDGKRIAYFHDNDLKIYDLDSNIETNVIPRVIKNDRFISAADFPTAWSPDGNGLLLNYFSKNQSSISYYSFETQTVIELIPQHSNMFCWSPDGKQFAYTFYIDGDSTRSQNYIRFYDFVNKEESFTAKIPCYGLKWDWASNGKYISLGSWENTIYIYNVFNKKTYSFTQGELISNGYPAWSANAEMLAVEGREKKEDGKFGLWYVYIPSDL